jgi:hypothetical protein
MSGPELAKACLTNQCLPLGPRDDVPGLRIRPPKLRPILADLLEDLVLPVPA